MAELILEPYAARLQWQMPDSPDGQPWGQILAEFLEALARRCEVEGHTVIGHIKGLSTFPQGGYLRVNVVSASHPADIAGAAPEGCTELTLTLNALVYGLPFEEVAGHVEETARHTASSWGGGVQVAPVVDRDHEPHHHHSPC